MCLQIKTALIRIQIETSDPGVIFCQYRKLDVLALITFQKMRGGGDREREREGGRRGREGGREEGERERERELAT